MNSNAKIINNKILIGTLITIPLLIIFVIIIFRHIIVPTDEDIINNLKNIKCYTCSVDYEFKNEKLEYKENTKQYYDAEKGVRIEFNDEGDRVKVYKGGEIKVQDKSDEYSLDKDMDIIYPLAFLDNIFSNNNAREIQEIKPDWSDEVYLKIDIDYNYKNKHLNNAEFYINKNTGNPVLLKIYDVNKNNRITIKYNEYKEEKQLNDELF